MIPEILAKLTAGACANPATRPHPDFLSAEHHRQVHAADWCHAVKCSVIIECAAAAVSANDSCVWGGTTDRDRLGGASSAGTHVAYERRLRGAARAYAARHHRTATPTRAQIAAARDRITAILDGQAAGGGDAA